MTNFWSFIWASFIVFAFVVYLMILFSVIADLFRDRALNGWYKVLWIVFLVWIPYLTAFVYLIARGRGMSERQLHAAERSQTAATEYIRHAAGVGGATEIAQAKALFDAGTITEGEYTSLKARALV